MRLNNRGRISPLPSLFPCEYGACIIWKWTVDWADAPVDTAPGY